MRHTGGRCQRAGASLDCEACDGASNRPWRPFSKRGRKHAPSLRLRLPAREPCSEPALLHCRLCRKRGCPRGGAGARGRSRVEPGPAVHAHGARRGAARRLPVRRRDRARRRGHRARAQPRPDQRRSHRPRRNHRDPALPRRSRQRGVARQHALHVRRVVRDVHGRDPVVPYRAARLRRVDRPTRHQDQPDHADGCRDRGESFLRTDFDHRRRAGGRGDGAVHEVTRVPLREILGFMHQRETSMLAIRAAKAATVAAIALFDSLVAFGNLTDYNTNLAFVEHVLSMDSIFPHSAIKYRAITSPMLQHAAYAAIIATEVAMAVLCWIGAAMLARRLRADAVAFNRAKTFAVIGLTLGFLLWHVGFMSIGGEWFGMWQSQQWDGVPSAFRFLVATIAVLIFVAMPDQELDGRGQA